MNTAIRNLIWEQWRPAIMMSGFILLIGFTALMLTSIGVRFGQIDTDIVPMVFVLSAIAMFGVIAFTLQSTSDVDARFPNWLYRLPLSSRQLAWTVLLARFTLLCFTLGLLYAAYQIAIMQARITIPHGISFWQFVFPLACSYLLFQTIIWAPRGRILLVLLAVAGLILLLATDERILIRYGTHPAFALGIAIAGFGLAPVSVGHDRIGTTLFTVRGASANMKTMPPAPDFSSPLEAQVWFDYNSLGKYFVYSVWAVAVVISIAIITLLQFTFIREELFSLIPVYIVLFALSSIISMVIVSFMYNIAFMGLSSLPRTSVMRFMYIRPMHATDFARSRYIMFVRIMVLFVIGTFVILWLGFSIANQIVIHQHENMPVAFLGSEMFVHALEMPIRSADINITTSNMVFYAVTLTLIIWVFYNMHNVFIFGSIALILLPVIIINAYFPDSDYSTFVRYWFLIASVLVTGIACALYVAAFRRGMICQVPLLTIAILLAMMMLIPFDQEMLIPIGLSKAREAGILLPLLWSLLVISTIPFAANPLYIDWKRHRLGR